MAAGAAREESRKRRAVPRTLGRRPHGELAHRCTAPDLDSRCLRGLLEGADKGPGAARQRREQHLAAYGPGGVSLHTFDVSELHATAWTDTVLLTGVALIRGAYQDQKFEHQLRFLDVYRYGAAGWQLVASSATDIVDGRNRRSTPRDEVVEEDRPRGAGDGSTHGTQTDEL